ncbi:MAG: Demethylmenaquinone methyltransferase [Syntrophomonadaceae bacterium]|nr:Demethylmenaquinone methyltransferase [Bacillota bacterium]
MSEYVSLVAKSGQVNTPPGSYRTVKEWALHSFMRPDSEVLEIGCSTGFIAIEFAKYTGAKIVGLDSSTESIVTAQQNINAEPAGRCTFLVGNAGNLPFPEKRFSHVVIGGHLPFTPHQLRLPHVMEATRVLRPWGFLLTALYYYHTTPPVELVQRFNAEVGTQLQPEYNRDYWSSFFEHPELELERESVYAFSLSDEDRIQQYLEQLNPETRPKWDHRLRLFTENGRYLRFFVRVYRRYPTGATLRQIPRGGIYTNFHLVERRER